MALNPSAPPVRLGAPESDEDQERTPYQLPPLPDLVPDLAVADLIPDDERVWVPQSASVSFRPMLFGVTQGFYVNLLRVRRAGVLSRHRHSGPVLAVVLKGRWHYLEHDWEAVEGGYAFEVPGEVHTLVVPEAEEMITLFHVTGCLVYVDPFGKAVGYEDVFTKLELARAHYEDVGLGAGFADQFVR